MFSRHRSNRLARRSDALGLTLVELMIALTIGLLIMLATSVLFLGSSKTRREVELSADVIESGRYAIDLLNREISQAGFYGSLAVPTGTDDTKICSTAAADWQNSLTFQVFGWNSSPASLTSTLCGGVGAATRKTGTDAIFVQRLSTCVLDGGATCDDEDANNAYMQVSECGTEYSGLTDPFVLKAGFTSGVFNLKTNACVSGTVASKRRLIRRIYYISGGNALSFVDIQLNGEQAPVTLVENIEQMQIEYAVASSTSKGTAETFTATPSTVQWPFVVGARLWLISRSTDTSNSSSGAVNFEIGDFTGAGAVAYAAATTNPKRRVYSTYIPLTTPKSRLEGKL